MHTQSGVAERFLNDVKTELPKLLLNPTKPVDGKVLIKKQYNRTLKKNFFVFLDGNLRFGSKSSRSIAGGRFHEIVH